MDESYLCAGIGGATTGGVAPSDFLFSDRMSPPRFPLPIFWGIWSKVDMRGAVT